jgi:uncharacterized protein YydD (DUF2326 family)
MKIKSLSISNTREITFNTEGLNLILAKKSSKNSVGAGSSNGVGKSLLIAFIRYCLGGGSDLGEGLRKHQETLNVDTVEMILQNGKKEEVLIRETINKKYKPNLGLIYPTTKYLTDLTIVSRFIREPHSYQEYLKCSDVKESNESSQKTTAFLLGLDVARIDRRMMLLDELDTSKKQQKLFKSEIKKEENVSGTKRYEKDKLETDLKNTKIASNYTEIVKENDDLVNALQEKRNRLLSIEYDIESIDKSLYITKDITKEDMESFFGEVKFQMPDSVIKRLDDVQTFNDSLIKDRQNVLSSQKKKLVQEMSLLKEEISKLEIKVDNNFRYLKDHRALDEYAEVSNKISNLRFELAKLEELKDKSSKMEVKIRELEGKIIEEDDRTSEFLDKNKSHIETLQSLFAEIVEFVYKENKGNLVINKHEGGSKTDRYDFKAKIQKDDSDGIESVRTFCWDWTLFLSQKSVPIDFMFHDSKIFHGVDPKQIIEMIKFAKDRCAKFGKQYIVSMNYDQYEHVKDIILEKEIRLVLSDESNQDMLLKYDIDDFTY